MNCPNENAEMHQVTVQSHYGQPIFLEQCEKCGGIWFDEAELYRAKLGEAEKIESINSELLQTSTEIKKAKLLCPKDDTELHLFTDKNFPQSIIVERCPTCSGFWLNRGEFTRYQKARRELMRPREKSAEDKKLEANIQKLLAEYQTAGNTNSLQKLAKFLTTPLDENTLLPLDSDEQPPSEGKNVGLLLDILSTILRLFIFR